MFCRAYYILLRGFVYFVLLKKEVWETELNEQTYFSNVRLCRLSLNIYYEHFFVGAGKPKFIVFFFVVVVFN